ncbi:MFS transporter [Pseudooceanicola algae]|uniref:Inner membrane transport protein YdhC n=1 Tax=Pseudooceanicola algae TaxID=1537215 RepID=A0A418SHJ3_9RHOB|nr:hypothetical protein [Pseudooceanicola algae]QPM90367.1 Inner membrane transport protein YdhC [Pseudooceanicola algae]
MAFLIGICLGQLVLGPVSVRTCRKPGALMGVGLFLATSLGDLFVAGPNQLLFRRLAQGVKGVVGKVVGLALLMAPLLGSAIPVVTRRQAIFATLAGLAALVFVPMLFVMPLRANALRDAPSCQCSW